MINYSSVELYAFDEFHKIALYIADVVHNNNNNIIRHNAPPTAKSSTPAHRHPCVFGNYLLMSDSRRRRVALTGRLVTSAGIIYDTGKTRSSCHRNSINHRKREVDECYVPVVVIHVNRKITPTRAPEQKGRGGSAHYVIATKGLRWSASRACTMRWPAATGHDTITGFTRRYFFPRAYIYYNIRAFLTT